MSCWCGADDHVHLKFPKPAHPLSTNEANRMHWATKRRQLLPWFEGAFYAARIQKVQDLPPSVVQLRLPFRTGHRRDPSNYVGTVVKAAIDGLVQAGVWPDDDPRWVTVLEPECLRSADAEIVITPRQEQD